MPAASDQQRRERCGAEFEAVRSDPAQCGECARSKGGISEDNEQIPDDRCADNQTEQSVGDSVASGATW